MKIEWNKVTWYSKFAAVIIFVATFWLGFYLGTMNAEKIYVEVPHLVRNPDHIASTDLNVPQNSIGVLSENKLESATTTFVGYYSTRFEKYGEEDTVENLTCEEFIVKKSNDPLWRSLEAKVLAGNTINQIDERSGDLILNIDTGELDPLLKAKILRSGTSSPIALQIIEKASYGKGASPCYSFVKIVGEGDTTSQ